MDIQEAIDRFGMRNKRIDRQAFHPLGGWIDKETYDELIQFRADNLLAIEALKEKQEREKPIVYLVMEEFLGEEGIDKAFLIEQEAKDYADRQNSRWSGAWRVQKLEVEEGQWAIRAEK